MEDARLGESFAVSESFALSANWVGVGVAAGGSAAVESGLAED